MIFFPVFFFFFVLSQPSLSIYTPNTHTKISDPEKVMRLVSYGSNQNGELGSSIDKCSLQAQGVDHSNNLRSVVVIDQCSKGAFNVVLVNHTSSSGKARNAAGKLVLVSWGSNEHGQLGIGTNEILNTNVPSLVDMLPFGSEEVVKLSCGEDHVLMLTNAGNVFSMGSNYYGQLGVGDPTALSLKPVLVSYFKSKKKKIKKIFTGNFHSFAVDESGMVYCWGRTDEYQCGEITGENKNSYLPFFFNVSMKVDTVIAGTSHSVFIGKNMKMLAIGFNSEGQLGIGNFKVSKKLVEVKIISGKRIVSMCANNYHNSVVLENGTAYAWGCNEDGQLGIGSKKNQNTPVQLSYSEYQFNQSSCGKYHIAYKTTNGRIFSSGSNELGQIGDNTQSERIELEELMLTPIINDESKILSITSGMEHNLLVTEGYPFCNKIKYDSEEVCSGTGKCIDEDYCTCDEFRKGTFCEYWVCFEKYLPTEVCSGHGECAAHDYCSCTKGFSGDKCQYYSCFGKQSNDPNVCAHHGICTGSNKCKCLTPDFGGENCSIPFCYGILGNLSHACSYQGRCISPDRCECNAIWMGSFCAMNKIVLFLLVFVLAVLLISILILFFGRKTIERKQFSQIFLLKSRKKKKKKILDIDDFDKKKPSIFEKIQTAIKDSKKKKKRVKRKKNESIYDIERENAENEETKPLVTEVNSFNSEKDEDEIFEV